MKRAFLFMVVVILFTTLSCSIFRDSYNTPYYGTRPKHLEFRLKNRILTEDVYQVIDTNAVYINSFFDSANQDTIFSAIRFFSRGRFYKSIGGSPRELIEEQYNHVDSSGFMGYFIMEKGVIKVEVFQNEHYVTQKFKVLDNGIKEISARIDGIGADVSSKDTYLKYYPTKLESKPNW